MPYAARPAAEPDAPWVQPGEQPTTLGKIDCSQAWLAGLSEEELAEHELARAEVVGVQPFAGLGNPPVLQDVEGQPTWVWSAEGVNNLRALRVAEVKAEAERRILARFPITAQLNMIRHGESLAWVDDVRAASNAIEAALPEDVASLTAFDAASAAWPE